MCQICQLSDELDKTQKFEIKDAQSFSRLMLTVHALDIFDFELQDNDLV